MSAMDGDRPQQWSQRLRAARRQGRTAQTQALLAAFAKIDDTILRGQFVVMLEVAASNPQLLARLKAFALGCSPDEPAENVVYLTAPNSG